MYLVIDNPDIRSYVCVNLILLSAFFFLFIEVLPNIPNVRDDPIGLQVSDRALHQVMSRIFAIVLREKLHYRNVSLVPLVYTSNASTNKIEEINYRNIFDQLR